ncbi:hypothetical protein [Vannielia litorea]|uniref:hypothetical protein n=1 Tax=Vannielia litorea TaxID=1217970 RepID=UPI001BD0E029|nr:hypothetical protein [Vannielia litorea]MBS8225912.1 hypothetical protein [Vannielia litorea]
MPPYDDPNISDEDLIVRRVNPEQHLVYDENLGRQRVSSKLFAASSGPEGGMSVDIPALMVADGVVAEEFVKTPPFLGAVSFTAGCIREAHLIVGYHPIPDNPYHGEVWRAPDGGRFTRAQKKHLSENYEWFVKVSED